MSGKTAAPPRAGVPAASNGHPAGPAGGVGVRLPTRQKRPGFVALAVVLMVGLAALGGYFYTQAGQKFPVVMVVHDVPAGHPITRADLSTVEVAGQVTALGAARLDSIVGKTAAVELLPNTLVQRAMVTTAPALAAGSAQVGVQVKPGQIPADGLSPGDTVEILGLPAKDGPTGSATTTVLAGQAEVFAAAADPSQSGGTLLTVVVAKSAVGGIVAASNAGLIALVRVGR